MNLSHKKRLKDLLEAEKLSNASFGRNTGYDPRNLSNYLTGSTTFPNGELVMKVLKHYPHWNIRYWLLGEGNPRQEEEQS